MKHHYIFIQDYSRW